MTAGLYRSHAAECLRLLREASNSQNAASLRAMAIAWVDLAEAEERTSRTDSRSPSPPPNLPARAVHFGEIQTLAHRSTGAASAHHFAHDPVKLGPTESWVDLNFSHFCDLT
jgi:hypothetical protein